MVSAHADARKSAIPRAPRRGMAVARFPIVKALEKDGRRYTASCVHCSRTIFREAVRIGEVQLRMVEYHILVCRPLVAIERSSELLRHFNISECAA